MATFVSSLKSKIIYVFAIDDERHRDCLKIGETTLDENDGSDLFANTEVLEKAARKRIDQYTKTAGIAYQLLHTEISIFVHNGMIFTCNDKQVHECLRRSGVKKKEFPGVKGADEWYCCDLVTVKKAIAAVKRGEQSLHPSDVTTNDNPIIFRPEQAEAIQKTRKRFAHGNQMLWNAKMRFGKTLCALRVARDLEMQRTIILTHRPVVDEGWFEDFGKVFYDRSDYHYGSRTKGDSFDNLERFAQKGEKYVYFASMQDMRGSELVGGKFDKNNEVFSTVWDYLIVDEAHEGTQTELGQNVIRELVKPGTKVLNLSGTPFNLLDGYNEEEIYTWDYVMEQKAKAEWDVLHPGELNPYASLPAINIYTYDLGTLMSEYADDEKAFNFREFFRTREDETFIHEKDVDNFLTLLCKDDKESLYPFSNDEYRRIFRHTLWVVPGVKAARALSTKLKAHPVFGNFEIVNVAGDGDEDEENADALQMVNKAIGADPDATYTITLSCGRLTTGVSIKPWTAVFMMAGSYSTSAANYMQTIFRVQTPFTHKGRMKEQCYAFDFAPDRTLRVLATVAKVSAKAGKATDEDRRVLGDFLNFCPIISIEGSKMNPYDVNKMMGQLKKAQIEKVVQCGFEDGALYNDELLKLTDIDLKDFQELKGTIGKTKAMGKIGDIDVNNQGFTNEEYEEKEKLEKKPKKERTPEEQKRLDELKQRHNQRKEAISILRGISIRMPLLIFGAELTNEEEEITIDNFANLIDDQSWEEFMPKGVSKEMFGKFKKFYEPDVFREAGKRIRAMARAADKFTIEQRIERIAGIFNTFRNPDKETVLTPWRVVNMHMSDCLGGWCFYDEDFKHPIEVPRFVDQGQVTKDVFRPEAHILEINSKSGLYPLYVAYNIYRARVEAVKAKYGEIGHAFAMQLWDLTIENNILVVCKTPMARSITKRTLAGFRDTTVNARYYKNLIENISEKPAVVINTFRDGRRFWNIKDVENMKFDAIVGNPPYQVMDGGGTGSSAVPIYQKFVQLSKKLSPCYISMIMPAKWYTGGRGLDDFREEMLNDKRISFLADFDDSRVCFPTADIAGGVCYFRWASRHEGLCHFESIRKDGRTTRDRRLNEGEVFIRDLGALDIINKVQAFGEKNMSEQVFSSNPFGFRSYYEGKTSPFANSIRMFTSKGWVYASKGEITSNADVVGTWKAIMSKAGAEHAGQADNTGMKKVVSRIDVLAPGEICSESYLLLGCYETKEEAEHLVAYMKTRFVRFLLSNLLLTQNIAKDKFRLIPIQDFKQSWTDSRLYQKYGLTDEEQLYVEALIKPID